MSQHNFKRDQSMAVNKEDHAPFTYFIKYLCVRGNLSIYYKEANLPLWCLSSRHPLFVMFNKKGQSEPQCFIKTDSFVIKNPDPRWSCTDNRLFVIVDKVLPRDSHCCAGNMIYLCQFYLIIIHWLKSINTKHLIEIEELRHNLILYSRTCNLAVVKHY